MLKTGGLEESINIDSSDCLFHKHFRSLQENIDTLDFWSMMPDLAIGSGGTTYAIEVAHHDQYNWSSCWCPKPGEDFQKLCQIFLNLPAYSGSIVEAQVSEVNASWARYPPTLKVQTAQEMEQEIEVELQALKVKLTDRS